MKVKSRAIIVLFTLAIVLSLSLVTLVPVMAQDGSWWDYPEEPILFVILAGFPFPGGQAVSGQGWNVGDLVDLYINGEYVATTEAGPNAEGNASPIFDTNSWGVIQPGDEVKLVRQSDELTKEHVVTSFTTFVNAEDDKVYGEADRGANIVVIVPFGETSIAQFDTAASNGSWSVDFESMYDITYGIYGATGQYDDEYDMTAVFWSPTETSGLAPASALAKTYGGLENAAVVLGFNSVEELQMAIKAYYADE